MKFPFMEFFLGLVLGVFVATIGYEEFHQTPSGGIEISSPSTVLEAPPKYLLINGERWYLVAYDFSKDPKYAKTGIDGETDCDRRDIWYDSEEKQRPHLREIMWHEIFHASYCYQGSRMKANWSAYVHDSAEHEIVYEAGMFLPGFVHDNPEFMQWAEDWK